MSTHFTLVSLLRQTPCRTQLRLFSQPLTTRSFTKPTVFFRPNNNIRQVLKPHGRSVPIFYKQQNWTSTVSTPVDKKEERVIYNNWLDHLPAQVAPYAFLTRLDKPIGTWLLFWPCGMYNINIYAFL